MKLDREKLVQELCTSFTHREIKILLGKRGKKICLDKDFTNLREVSDLEL